MAKQWVKKELRRDPLASFVVAVYGAVNKNRSTALSAAVVVVVCAVFGAIILSAHRKNVNEAFADIIRAQTVVYSRPDMALSLCDKVLSAFNDSSNINALALYVKGDALFVKGDFDGAGKTYKSALPHIQDEFKPNVLLGMAKNEESLGDMEGALQNYREFISSYDRHYLSPDAYLSVARILVKAGRIEEAAQYIEVIKGRFQNTKWAKYAEDLQGSGISERVSESGNNR